MLQALRTRRATSIATLFVLALALAGGTQGAEAAPGVHPTMGNSTLNWHTRLTDAQADAKRQGKLLFVEVSRAPSRCIKCRALFSSVLSSRKLAGRMDAVAVGVHFDWRGVDRTVFKRIQRNLRTQNVDPTVAFLTPELGFVSGYAPGRNDRATVMRTNLERALIKAERKHSDMNDTKPRVGSATSRDVDGEKGTSSVREQPTVVKPQPQPIRKKTTTPARFTWYRNIRAAQKAARDQGKFLMLVSTKPNCGLCKKLKSTVIPQCKNDIARYAIAYVYDIQRPESGQVDRLVRSMNRGARLMPLAGFATPDLKPLKGFAGPTTAAQLRSLVRQADRTYRSR